MAAASRILPTSGGGFGAWDNRLHRGAIPELAAVFSAVCTVREGRPASSFQAGSVVVPDRAFHFAPQ